VTTCPVAGVMTCGRTRLGGNPSDELTQSARTGARICRPTA
jgi:hypothetical protein